MSKEVVKKETNQVECVPRREEIIPSTAVRQEKDGFLLVAEVPGVCDKSLNVTVENGVLSIKADNSVATPEGYRIALREISAVTYKASFELPDRVDPAGVKAVLKNGLLRSTLPLSEAKKPRKITIDAE